MSTVYKYYKYKEHAIQYSVVTPIYNQERIIVKNIKSVIKNTLETFEIILILDYCFDKTEEKLLEFLDHFKNPPENLVQITIFKNSEKPLFETKCDNIGFKNAKGDFCLEIQADMEMTESGYNLQLSRPFKKYNNVIAVSGRCAHNLFNGDGIGKMTEILKTVEEMGVDRNKFYVYETCNRGPLLLDRKKLEELNYLDDESYFLDNSDHDLMARAFLTKNYVCGYMAIDFNAPLEDGSTRNHVNYDCAEYIVNRKEKERLSFICKSKPGLKKYISIWKQRNPIIVDI